MTEPPEGTTWSTDRQKTSSSRAEIETHTGDASPTSRVEAGIAPETDHDAAAADDAEARFTALAARVAAARTADRAGTSTSVLTDVWSEPGADRGPGPSPEPGADRGPDPSPEPGADPSSSAAVLPGDRADEPPAPPSPAAAGTAEEDVTAADDASPDSSPTVRAAPAAPAERDVVVAPEDLAERDAVVAPEEPAESDADFAPEEPAESDADVAPGEPAGRGVDAGETGVGRPGDPSGAEAAGPDAEVGGEGDRASGAAVDHGDVAEPARGVESAGTGDGAVRPELDELADPERLRAAIEAVLLVLDTPTGALTIAQVLGRSVPEVVGALQSLRDEYDAGGRGMDLREVADGWRLYSRDEFAGYVERFILDGQQARLTQAALETLAVIAYRQPVTRSRISGIRGVSVDAVMRTLLTRGLVEECGADPDTGGGLYRTTRLFLEKMGLRSLDELPSLAPLLPDTSQLDDVELAT